MTGSLAYFVWGFVVSLVLVAPLVVLGNRHGDAGARHWVAAVMFALLVGAAIALLNMGR